MSGGDDLLCLFGIGGPRQADVEADSHLEAAIIGGLQVDLRIDADLAQVGLLATCDCAEVSLLRVPLDRGWRGPEGVRAVHPTGLEDLAVRVLDDCLTCPSP